MRKRARKEKPKILCVDDEPQVLEGLKLHLRKHFKILTAEGGEEGLKLLEERGPFAVVLSDMRMPGMDGAAFLSQVHQRAPTTVRMLLTGHADLDAAISAVNDGQIFRFLTKPCPPPTLIAALQSGADIYRLASAEKELLEKTLRGSIKMLTEVLSLTSPVAYGRAGRIQGLAGRLARASGLGDAWYVEVAAILSQIGTVTLPEATVEKLYQGATLSVTEQKLVDELPSVAIRLLEQIPRMEPVKEAISNIYRRYDGLDDPSGKMKGDAIPVASRIIKIVIDYDVLVAQGYHSDTIFDTMRGRRGWYDETLLEAFAEELGNAGRRFEIREVTIAFLKEGMVFAEDVRSKKGMLLIARGNEVTLSHLTRLKHYPVGTVLEPVRVIVSDFDEF